VAEIQRGRAAPVPVIFVSARIDLDTRLQAVRAGGHGYFTKPVDVARLAEKLEILIAHPAADLDALRIVFEREVAAMTRKILGEVCVEKGWVTEAQLDDVASQPGDARAVADALVARGWISPAQRQEALAVLFERQMGARRKGAFGEICVEKKWITEAQLEDARSRQSVLAGRGAANILDVLVLEGAITPQQKAEAQGIAWGIPFVDLATMLLNPEVTRSLLGSIDAETCRQLKVVPFQRSRWRVRVAMQNPLDVVAQDRITALIDKGLAIELAIAAEEDILHVLEQATRGSQGTLAISGSEVQIATPTADRRVPKVETLTVPAMPDHYRSGPAYFTYCLLHDQPFEGIVSPQIARDAQEILEAGFYSMDEGKEIGLPLKSFLG
jgi:CheY-like chemotaxis protein